MLKDSLKYRVNYYLILIAAFVIPLHKNFIPPVTLLLFLSSIWNFDKSFLRKKNALLIPVYFFVIVIGYLWSSNKGNALFEIELNLSFLLYPLILVISNIDFNNITNNILKSFLDGLLVSVILAFINSAIHYFSSYDINEFFYDGLTFFHHSSYLSMYACFGVAILYYWSFHPNKNRYISPTTNAIIIGLFSIFTLFLMSKMGILLMLLVHLYSIGFWIVKHNKVVIGLIILTSTITFLVLAFSFNTSLNNRFKELLTYNEGEVISESSSGARIIAWQGCIENFKAHPLIGVGTGDVNEALNEYYMKSGHPTLALKSLNAHNQFLHTLVKEGILGLVSLAFIIWLPFFKNSQNQETMKLYVVFILIFLISCLTEAMLQTQSGIVFFAFFISIFSLLKTPSSVAKDHS
ncbi:MAG: O-antigen ligase family protein [Flavobacteriales bacterium]|nr:O-antigen ligase family protein [Flavobacteriales bacterium]